MTTYSQRRPAQQRQQRQSKTTYPSGAPKGDPALAAAVELPIIDAVRFSGYSQIDFLVSSQLIRVLNAPPFVFAVYDTDNDAVWLQALTTRIEGARKLRVSSRGSNIITSGDLARALYRLNPQGRYFDVSQINEDEGIKSAVITKADVSSLYAHHRFEPENPFFSPRYNREAGLEFERTGVIPKPQYPNRVQGTVQTQVPNSPTVNQNGLPTPRAFGLDFDTYAEWWADFKANRAKLTPIEQAYKTAYQQVEKLLKEDVDAS